MEYRLTELGESLLLPLICLIAWAEKSQSGIAAARTLFEFGRSVAGRGSALAGERIRVACGWRMATAMSRCEPAEIEPMRGALGGPRVLLRRLREVMAEPVSAQDRLDKIVVLIAANMVAEVCSVYVLRMDGTLELYATEGLNKEAVHQTVMRIDEGLVGLVASQANAINLSDAQSHPAFSYRPETGEEIYHSYLGVPILRAGNTLGVLVVQNRAHRNYSEEEEEALQTTAMVLAEMIASGRAVPAARHARRRTGGASQAPSHRHAARRRHRARPRRTA